MTPDKPDLSAEADLRMMEVLRLLQHLVTPRRPSGPEDPAAPAGRTAVLSELAADMEAICEALDLKRAVVFEAIYDKYFDGVRLSPLAACVDGLSSTSSEVGAKSRQQGRSQGSEDLSIGTKSEVFSLLHDGQWIPIGQAGGSTTSASTASIPHHLRELSDFL
ncbi:MAG: hypothetical protein JSS86_18740, partial [Cyanobacteria bacterium SZAS LIN-2]|nr:hypothetical protein [Cyanobacteria bacterium SZAS LIN-2]